MADPTHKEIGGKGDERVAELGLGKMEKNRSEVPEGSGEKGSNINIKGRWGVESKAAGEGEHLCRRGGGVWRLPRSWSFFLLFLFRF